MSSLSVRPSIPGATRNRPAVSDEGTRAEEYVGRNKEAWERWAPAQVARGRQAWLHGELCWGIWNTSESELRLVDDVPPRADAIELGCGTAAISAAFATRGLRPVAVDFSKSQLATAAKFQFEFDISFPLICANAEEVPFDDESFDLAVSEYGVSLWSDPRNWLPEAQRLLRPSGLLIFLTNAPLLMACTPPDGGVAGTTLQRDYFARYRVEFTNDGGGVEFHAPHGHWIRLLRAHGFSLENLVEVRPRAREEPRFAFVSADWARRWPTEEIWVARKLA